jgi:glycosyltransferase involved in cell wall biosynthesis
MEDGVRLKRLATGDRVLLADGRGEPLKVLFLFAWLVVGGEETEVRLLYKHLDPRRFRLHVLSTYRKENMTATTERALRDMGVPLDTTCYSLPDEAKPATIARKIARERYDVVVACQGCRLLYDVFDRLERRPALVEHGGLVSEVFHTPKHYTTAYVGVCRAIRDAAASVMENPENAIEIPSVVDLTEFNPSHRAAARAELGAVGHEPLIGWVGRLDPKKRVEDFVEAAGIVGRERRDARFVIIGGIDAFFPEYRDRLVERVRELGLAERFVFTGDRSDVPRLLSGLDVFCWLSRGEGMPHVIAEAGAAGLPVIATRDGGTPQQIQDGVSGLFVPHEDPPAIARSVLRLLEQPELRARLGAALRAKVVSEYSIEAVLPLWEALLERVADKQTTDVRQQTSDDRSSITERLKSEV